MNDAEGNGIDVKVIKKCVDSLGKVWYGRLGIA